VKAQELEVLARKSLVAGNARLKIAISRRVGEIVARLEDPGVPIRSAAQALGALAPILRLIDGWSRALDIEGMELARTSNDAKRQSLVNLALINTTPEQLAKLAIANSTHLTECNGLSVGPSAVAPEQPTAAPHDCPRSKNEAPPLPVKQPGKSEPTASLRPVQTKQDSQNDPLPAGHPASSTSVSEAEARQEAFEQLRAEHRRVCRLKYG
jgi:hypothetical protein